MQYCVPQCYAHASRRAALVCTDVLSREGQHPQDCACWKVLYLRAPPSSHAARDACMPAQSPPPLKGLWRSHQHNAERIMRNALTRTVRLNRPHNLRYVECPRLHPCNQSVAAHPCAAELFYPAHPLRCTLAHATHPPFSRCAAHRSRSRAARFVVARVRTACGAHAREERRSRLSLKVSIVLAASRASE